MRFGSKFFCESMGWTAMSAPTCARISRTVCASCVANVERVNVPNAMPSAMMIATFDERRGFRVRFRRMM